MRTLTLCSLLVVLSIPAVTAANHEAETGSKHKILILTPLGSKSHKIFFMAVAKALASVGNQVTIVSTLKDSKEFPNVRDVVIFGQSAMHILNNPFETNPQALVTDLLIKLPRACSECLAAKEVQDLKREQFDLIIISMLVTDCFLSLVHHFKVPFVYMSPSALTSVYHELGGNIYFESLTPHIFLAPIFPMTFLERMQSSISTTVLNILYIYFTGPSSRRYCDDAKLCPPDMPPFQHYYGNNSLIIVNSIRSLQVPAQPSMPNIIHAGGIHCRPAKPLPKNLEDWIEDAGKKGFIYFSLGSIVSPSFMPEKYRQIFIKVFASLQVKVLWRWDEEYMEDLPSNVKILKWIPQQDVLAHPNVRLFITHGGLLSTEEALYHNCPMLGLPLYADQFGNIKQATNEGWAEQIYWSELSEELLKSKIDFILNNNDMKEITTKRSNIMKDRITEPAEEVTYWIEYVIKHDGADHLKSPRRKIYLYELYNIDVWLTIFFTLLISLIITVKFSVYIISKLFRKKSKRD